MIREPCLLTFTVEYNQVATTAIISKQKESKKMAHTFAIKSYFDPEELILREERLSMTMPVGAFILGNEFASYSGNAGGGGPGGAAANAPQSSSSGGGGGGPSTSGSERNVPRDTKVHVPLWAAHALRMQGLAAIAVPESCTYASFREFRQDPMGPNIRVKSPFFFDLASEAASVAPPQEAPRLRGRLVELYRKRYPSVLAVGNKKGFDLSEARDALSNTERKIVDKTIERAAHEKQWYAEQR